jgi:hypothetical protein
MVWLDVTFQTKGLDSHQFAPISSTKSRNKDFRDLNTFEVLGNFMFESVQGRSLKLTRFVNT